MKSIFLSIFLCFVVAGANAQQGSGIATNAPAGFTWGDTKQQIESKGIKFKACLETKLGLACVVDSAPKEISFVDKYNLLFIEGRGLQKIVMHTDNVTNDPTGREGKQLYDEVKKNLISKYGQSESSYEFIGRELYDEPDEFYQCLEYAECGFWVSFWVGEGSISLEINGLSRGVGYISLHYESKDIDEITVKKEAAESSKDIEAL